MSKNLIPQIAEMLNVEIGEEFKVKGDNVTYKFTSDGLKLIQCDGFGLEITVDANPKLYSLLNGKDEIIKIPYKPKNGEDYYTFGTSAGKWMVWGQRWTNHPVDLALLAKGWVFRSNKEAEAELPKVAIEFGAKYEL